MRLLKLAIISDIHYAGPAEQARRDYLCAPIKNPLRRWLIQQYRHYIWLRDPFAHNHLLDRFLAEAAGADLVVANGDYSCDSAYVGVIDDAAFQSAHECLGKLRRQFGDRFHATIGDHEIGKKMFGADEGGLRLGSYLRTLNELDLKPIWQLEYGTYVLIGITSTLLALPLFESEMLSAEQRQWAELRQEHVDALRQVFDRLRPSQRVLLFCHDPSALPFLWSEDFVRDRVDQIERTIIGHLHTRFVYRQSQRLAGLPPIRFLGHTPRRLSSALHKARHWRPFKPLLCPSTAGIQLLKDGGFYRVELDVTGKVPVQFDFHPLPW